MVAENAGADPVDDHGSTGDVAELEAVDPRHGGSGDGSNDDPV